MIVFTVTGDPVPQPRPKVSTRGGFARAYYDRKSRVVPWKQAIREQSEPHRPDLVLSGPLRVQLAFHIRRPKAMRKPEGPTWHTKSNADADNLAKSVLDALTDAGWWNDDGQVCGLEVVKFIAGAGDEPGVRICIEELPS